MGALPLFLELPADDDLADVRPLLAAPGLDAYAVGRAAEIDGGDLDVVAPGRERPARARIDHSGRRQEPELLAQLDAARQRPDGAQAWARRDDKLAGRETVERERHGHVVAPRHRGDKRRPRTSG